jgi:Flp pilus assembly protein TadG
MRFNRAEEGQALVLTGLGLLVLMLMAGLGIDVGYLRYEKQQMQKAADAGALAAASARIYGGDYTDAGKNDAKANGFTDGQNGIHVTVNYPPNTNGDPFKGNNNYVEVIVAQASQRSSCAQVASIP